VSPDTSGGGPPREGPPRHAALEGAREAAGISHDDLWLRYFSLTGDAAPLEVEAYLQGLMPLPALQQDIIAQALHECLSDQRETGRDVAGSTFVEYDPARQDHHGPASQDGRGRGSQDHHGAAGQDHHGPAGEPPSPG
jgi:hypothetical protein